MSVRRAPNASPQSANAANAQQFRMEIESMRTAQAMAEQLSPEQQMAMTGENGDATAVHFDQLNETEKSAAMIGAGADEWKPISWMNQAHYATLLKNNALGGRLTQKIEAYKVVSGQ